MAEIDFPYTTSDMDSSYRGEGDELLTEAGQQRYDGQEFSSPWAPKKYKAAPILNYSLAAIISIIVSGICAVSFPICRHWSLIPLTLCGSLAGADLIAWIRGEIDTFDLKVPVAGVLYLNCSLAPLLNMGYGIYSREVYTRDWPLFFGYMACFNLAGIFSLKLAEIMSFRLIKPVKSIWSIDSSKMTMILLPVLGISLLASLVVRIFFGGLIKQFGSLVGVSSGAVEYLGHASWLIMLGDPAPTLIMMAIIHFVSRGLRNSRPSVFLVWFVLIAMAAFQFFWVGLRGSRSAIMWGVIAVTAMIHFRWRPFRIRTILLGMFVIFIFIHLYDYRKKLGPRGWAAFYSAKAREELSYEKGGTLLNTLLGDLAKADIQAFLLYGLMENVPDYKYLYGRTYVMSALTFVPRGIWKNKPKSPKLVAGTQLQGYSSTVTSSRVYGLAGEAMLNFGYYAIVPAFFIYGWVLGWIRKKIASMDPFDSRFFLVPLLLVVCQISITGDTDNWVFGVVKMGVLPFIVVFFGSVRQKFVLHE